MTGLDWPRLAAKAFAVVTLGLGAGLLAGGGAFVGIGESGSLRNGPFGHIAEVIGAGAGCLTASLATFLMILLGRRSDPRKSGMADPRGLD